VFDALRQYANRPLRDGDRVRLFVCAIAVILAAAGVLALLEGGGPAPERAEAPRPRPTATATVAPAGPTATATPVAPPSEEGPAKVASRAEVRAAKVAARRFLAGYLPFSYGHGRAREIRGASGELVRALAAQRPRVPHRIRERRARVRLLQSNGVDARAASLTAFVADGNGVYTVALELERAAGGRWTVTGVES
jgi:hypothetical protein